MKDEDLEILTTRMFNVMWRFGKWYIFQLILLFLTPYLWLNFLGTGFAIFIALYTLAYSIYWEFADTKNV